MTALAFSAIAYNFVDHILLWLAKPVGQFIFTSPSEAFFLHLKLALFTGTIGAFPVWMFQLWGSWGMR